MKKSCSNCAHMITYIGVDMCDRPGILRPRPTSIEADKSEWKGLKLVTCGEKRIFWEAKK